MTCIYEERIYSAEDIRKVVIQADTAPEEFPVNGVGVSGLADTAQIAPGSILYVVDEAKTYFMGEDGETWTAWGGGSAA